VIRVDPLPAGVSLQCCGLDDDAIMALEPARSLLSPAELDRAARFRFAQDRDRFIRARAFLRSVLGQATGDDPARLRLSEGPFGKPALDGGAIDFNLSHSGDLAVVALSSRGPVGVDVEFLDRRVDVEGLGRVCFTDEENAVIAALPPALRPARFFGFWTAKEARMKLTGEGMSLPPRSIALRLLDGWPVGCELPAEPAVRLVHCDCGRAGAVCCLAVTVPAKARSQPESR
jgi:4'-phosphopantetheinyl transferase